MLVRIQQNVLMETNVVSNFGQARPLPDCQPSAVTAKVCRATIGASSFETTQTDTGLSAALMCIPPASFAAAASRMMPSYAGFVQIRTAYTG